MWARPHARKGAGGAEHAHLLTLPLRAVLPKVTSSSHLLVIASSGCQSARLSQWFRSLLQHAQNESPHCDSHARSAANGSSAVEESHMLPM